MKKSKNLLMEMSGVTALPVVRKTLRTEKTEQKSAFDKLQAGDIITFPNKKGKFIVTKKAEFGQYIYYVPFQNLMMASSKELIGVEIFDRT